MHSSRRLLVEEVADSLRERGVVAPRYGVILGTGAGELGQQIEDPLAIPYGELSGFPQSTAIGHRGQWVSGRLAGNEVIAMQGRFHLYEGHTVERATLPIDVMHSLGVEVLFVSNASGGLAPTMKSGQIMAIASHVDLMFARAANSTTMPWLTDSRPTPRWGFRGGLYDPALISIAGTVARRSGFPLHRGVYAAMLGPNYETRAEYRFLRRLGADVVGMSTVPEVEAARARGLRVLGLSVVSNVARPDALQSTSGQEVVDAAAVAAPQLRQLVMGVIAALEDGR